MKHAGILLVLAFVALLLGFTPAWATVLTFDDLPSSPGSMYPIGTYGGLNWSEDFYYLNGSQYFEVNSGYRNGVISPNNVAFNAGGHAGDAPPFNRPGRCCSDRLQRLLWAPLLGLPRGWRSPLRAVKRRCLRPGGHESRCNNS